MFPTTLGYVTVVIHASILILSGSRSHDDKQQALLYLAGTGGEYERFWCLKTDRYIELIIKVQPSNKTINARPKRLISMHYYVLSNYRKLLIENAVETFAIILTKGGC